MNPLTSPTRLTRALVAAAVLCAPILAPAPHAAGIARADSSVIALGASLPLTGPLASFGNTIKTGYQRAVDDANAAGGGPDHKKFALTVRDNQSQPNLAASLSRSMIDEDGVVALLGSVSPPLNIPVSTVAETKHVPMITSLTPVLAWAAGNPAGWKYAWDMFFNEDQMTDLQYQASNLVKTNKKVALFTDNEQDGAVMGGLWASKAPKFGYTIAYHATFPVGTTDFGSFIAETKKAGATIIIAQMIPPDAFALWKQMKSLGYSPAVAFCEKCGNARSWSKELGSIGNGTMATTWWSPSLRRTQTKEFVDGYEAAFGNTSDLASVVATYSAAKVMIDAIKRAGSTDPEKINAALQATDADLPIAHVKFNDKHQSIVPALMAQWQGENMPMVYPKVNSSVVGVKELGLAQ